MNRLALLLSLALLAGCASLQPNARFDALVADYEVQQRAQAPDRDSGQWWDLSPEAVDRRNAANVDLHTRIRDIDATQLDPNRQVSHSVLEYLLRSDVETAQFRPQRFPFTNDSGFFTGPPQMAMNARFTSVEDAERQIQRLHGLPGFFDQHIAWMRDGLTAGWSQAAHVMPGVIDIVRGIAEVEPESSAFYQPFRRLPPSWSEEDRARIQAEGLAVTRDVILPAYRDLLRFFEQEYLPQARQEAGIHALPDGREYYRALVRLHTTLDTTPEAVHATGLAEVARIRAEMEAVIAQTDFEGSFVEFLHYLRTDPKFYAQSEEELLMRAAWLAKRADDQMPRFFRQLPRLPYGVRPVPAALAPNYTTGRYWAGNLERGQAGGYMVNTYRLDQRPLYELPSLTVHEGVPGHHHQIALAQELTDVPDFRRRAYITAFGEGWGLYTEFLAIEMGLYDTPYDHFGRLTFEMWRACRLVVDTGMHYFGWTVEQAEACLLENSALAPHNVRTEIARYVSWPGQALAYKTGELLIRKLRKEAEETLGERFNLRAFHDHLLSEGAMPLSALEARMKAWITAQQ